MSEDCLYLSIWSSSASPLTGVIVWLTSGREENLSGAELSGRGEVVVVRVESRRGALGYLATEDRLVTGELSGRI
jgi:carboxylesterase type B